MTKEEATKIIYCATHGKKCEECPMLKTCHGDINPNIDDCCEIYVTDAAEALRLDAEYRRKNMQRTKEQAVSEAEKIMVKKFREGCDVTGKVSMHMAFVSYTRDSKKPSWFHEKFEFADPPAVECDQLVWVRDSDGDDWTPRYAVRLLRNGKIECWANGTTSKTSKCSTTDWRYYRLTDPASEVEQ